MRDARPEDAPAIAETWAAARPLMVRSAARAEAGLREDVAVGRRRWVADLVGRVVGTSTARRRDDGAVTISVQLHPDFGSRRVGTALLAPTLAAFPEATELTAISNDDPIALAFSVRNGFLPTGEHRIAGLDPRTVPPAGPAPSGFREVRLDEIDPELVRDAHNASAADDPGGLSRVFDRETFRAEWREGPDHAPDARVAWRALTPPGNGGRWIMTTLTAPPLEPQPVEPEPATPKPVDPDMPPDPFTEPEPETQPGSPGEPGTPAPPAPPI